MEPEEIKKLLDSVNSGVVAMRTEVNELSAKNKTFETADSETKQKLDRISDSVTKALADIQAAQAKAEAVEAAVQRLGLVAQHMKDGDPAIVEKSKKALDHYLRKGTCEGFTVRDGEGVEVRGFDKRTMSTDQDPEGGYLVLPEQANFMVNRVFETSPLRQVARVLTVGSKSLEIPIDDDEAAANWAGEGAAGSNTDTPQVGKLTITAHKLEARPLVTTEMLEDGYLDVEAWLRDKVTDRFARAENTAFLLGTAANRPRGFLTYSNWASAGVYERSKIEQRAIGAASAVTADGLIGLQASLKEAYQGRATWLMKRQSFGDVLKLAGDDNYFFSPTLLKDGQVNLTLLGKRVLFADDMPAVATNALALAYGDFSVGYTIVDRVGVQVLRDPFSTKGFIEFYTTKRTGGNVTNFEAIKIGKIATSV